MSQYHASATNLSGAQRAAILVMYLERGLAGRLLRSLSAKELHDISMAMSEIDHVEAETVAKVISEFVRDLTDASMIPYSGQDYVRGVLPELVDEKQLPVLDVVRRRVNQEFADFCSTQPAEVLATLLNAETQQTQAVALGLMGPDNAARVLPLLPEDKQATVTMRMAKLKQVPGDLADDVIRAITEACDQQHDQLEVGGLSKTARILGNLGRAKNEGIFETIGENDQQMADDLRKRMVVFEDLITLDGRGMQTLMKQVSREDLVGALGGLTTNVADAFLKGVSSRAADDLRDEVEVRGRQPKKEVEAARFRIVETALKLAEDGQLFLPVGPDDS